ncbi:hypothetical protein EATG_01046 [Escherichia coli H605]|uniref:Uncharacterized protein n=1 Tax=Escherichia coli H605 TaxID=656410 RepID=A0AAJ3P1T5_ECOLX|nr:hypothetical protein EATG_01046 [Escherichia coli H605]
MAFWISMAYQQLIHKNCIINVKNIAASNAKFIQV